MLLVSSQQAKNVHFDMLLLATTQKLTSKLLSKQTNPLVLSKSLVSLTAVDYCNGILTKLTEQAMHATCINHLEHK